MLYVIYIIYVNILEILLYFQTALFLFRKFSVKLPLGEHNLISVTSGSTMHQPYTS